MRLCNTFFAAGEVGWKRTSRRTMSVETIMEQKTQADGRFLGVALAIGIGAGAAIGSGIGHGFGVPWAPGIGIALGAATALIVFFLTRAKRS